MFIIDYDGTICLVLFGLEKWNAINDRTRYLIGSKAVLHRFFSYNYAKIKIDSDDDLSLEETLNLYNVVILIKSILNKNQNHYCYDILLEKCSYQLAKK